LLGLVTCAGHYLLKEYYRLTPAEQTELAEWVAETKSPVIHHQRFSPKIELGYCPPYDPKEPRSLRLAKAWCLDGVLTPEYRAACENPSDQESREQGGMRSNALLAAALVEEYRGAVDEAVQYYCLALKWDGESYELARELPDFVENNLLSTAQLQRLAQAAKEYSVPLARRKARFDYLRKLYPEPIKSGNSHDILASEPEWLCDYRVYHAAHYWLPLIAQWDGLTQTEPSDDAFLGLSMREVLRFVSLWQTFELKLELQHSFLRDGRYPAEMAGLGRRYRSTGSTCTFQIPGAATAYLKGVPERRTEGL
jgi:hypothetical protein